ncbi:MAG: hypothetical protein V4529_17090 [Gemmatimonadota bacterium]
MTLISDGHMALADSGLSLASIGKKMRDEGRTQDEIDTTLAFVIRVREFIADNPSLKIEKPS